VILDAGRAEPKHDLGGDGGGVPPDVVIHPRRVVEDRSHHGFALEVLVGDVALGGIDVHEVVVELAAQTPAFSVGLMMQRSVKAPKYPNGHVYCVP